MGEKVNHLSQEEVGVERDELRKRRRELNLEKGSRDLRFAQAITTLSELALDNIDEGQEGIRMDIAEQGLLQKKGESSDEYMHRAAVICRANGFSAKEVAQLIVSRAGQSYVNYHLGSINKEESNDAVNNLADRIRKKYHPPKR